MLKRISLAVLILGCVHCLAYALVIAMSSHGNGLVSLQPDTNLYCQAARRICEGHPFSYTFGESASTGTTSVLYPFVLAIPYAFGAHGQTLIEIGFCLNALFYLVFLTGWTLTAWKWSEDGATRFLFPIVLALSAQPAICAFGQTDIGIWLAASSLFVAALAWKRWTGAAVLAILLPWLRPEGFVIAFALLICAPFVKTNRRQIILLAILAIASSLAVFALNWGLTGRCQFDSVAHKGYFKNDSFLQAIRLTVMDGLELARDYFLGLPKQIPHTLLFVPILSTAFIWLGIALRDWKKSLENGFVLGLVATAGSFAVVASSGWKGLNFDRYLVWATPFVLLLACDGCVRLTKFECLKNVRYLPLVLILGQAALGGATALTFAADSASRNAAENEYYAFCEELMSQEDRCAGSTAPRSVGGVSCGEAYFFGDRRFYHLSGLYSPDFFDYYKIPTALELLKHRTDLRPDYWVTEHLEKSIPVASRDQVLGRLLAVAPEGYNSLRVADWSAFDLGARIPPAPRKKKLIHRLDVGYLPDEKGGDYEVIDRWGLTPREIFHTTASLDGKLAVDAGRIIRGGDMMTIPLQPGKDCEVVVRTLAQRDGFEFNSPIKMLLNVDGEDVGYVGYDLNLKTNAFQEVSFTIPGRAIRQTPSRIGFLGDHIACGYWFFQ